jgi:hypothetical protein
MVILRCEEPTPPKLTGDGELGWIARPACQHEHGTRPPSKFPSSAHLQATMTETTTRPKQLPDPEGESPPSLGGTGWGARPGGSRRPRAAQRHRRAPNANTRAAATGAVSSPTRSAWASRAAKSAQVPTASQIAHVGSVRPRSNWKPWGSAISGTSGSRTTNWVSGRHQHSASQRACPASERSACGPPGSQREVPTSSACFAEAPVALSLRHTKCFRRALSDEGGDHLPVLPGLRRPQGPAETIALVTGGVAPGAGGTQRVKVPVALP